MEILWRVVGRILELLELGSTYPHLLCICINDNKQNVCVCDIRSKIKQFAKEVSVVENA